VGAGGNLGRRRAVGIEAGAYGGERGFAALLEALGDFVVEGLRDRRHQIFPVESIEKARPRVAGGVKLNILIHTKDF
jgi:hypothetical protein